MLSRASGKPVMKGKPVRDLADTEGLRSRSELIIAGL